MKLLRTLLVLGAVLLVALVAFQLYFVLGPQPKVTLKEPLANVLAKELPGWETEELPVADSAEMQDRLNVVLRFDDAVLRAYRRGSDTVLVYIAYWLPGKYPYNRVVTHTPDTCWVHSGWERQDRKYQVPIAVGNTALKPVEWGIYTKEGTRQEAIFWHVVGDRLYTTDLVGWDKNFWDKVKRQFGFFRDLKEFGLNQREEQFFIRISSNAQFKDLVRDPGFQKLLLSLYPIRAKSNGADVPAGDATK